MKDLLSDLSKRPRIASKRIRVGAALIDMLVFVIIFFLFGYFWGVPDTGLDGGGVRLEGWPAFGWFIFIFCLMPLQEGLTGKTIGGSRCFGECFLSAVEI